MRTLHGSTTWSRVIAPALAVWTFLALVAVAQAQDVAAADQDDANYAAQTLRVSIWHGKDADQIYSRGEPLSVTFQTNEDAYAVVYHIDVDGRVTVLWPTSRYSDGFVFGGHQYRLPTRDGERLRAGTSEGQGFFEAVVSRYPFDLRDLELDFHNEPEAVAHDYYVAGDPYLAMNEVNYVVTGLEDPSAYAVSNFTSYYVHRQVDHPRYLCFQCHDGDDAYDPYRDTCTITVEYDYGWQNQWWERWGYFPVYYYPVYLYVDPWSGSRWVNYWYDPWYVWPSSRWYNWRYDCYQWQYSPYWRHDVYAARKYEHRRYRPLDRDHLRRDRTTVRTKSDLVRADRPSDDRIRSMKDRKVVAATRSGNLDLDTRDRIRGGGGSPDVGAGPRERQPRDQERFESRPTTRTTSPGLRLDGARNGNSQVSRPPGAPSDESRVRTDERRDPRTRSGRETTRIGKPPVKQPGGTAPTVTPRDSRGRRRAPDHPPGGAAQGEQPQLSTRRSQGSARQRPTPPPPRTGNDSPRPTRQDPPRGAGVRSARSSRVTRARR
ncbi:MAG: DUF4384 domain-containing protein [Candidatus Krumholzibacteriia bacterium]